MTSHFEIPSSDPSPEFVVASRFIAEAVQGIRTAEILVSAITALGTVVPALTRVLEADPDLKPEVQEALDQVTQTVETLQRTARFVTARYEAAQNRMRAGLS